MKKRILFVDDEPRILEGLRNRLRRQRKKWDMFFVGSGREALELLATEAVDVVVSDMRMPQMDGAELLRRVQDEHPEVVRMVLSGHAEQEAAMKAVPVAHQYLTKPCEPGLLENVVERTCNLQALIGDETLRQTVGRIQTLPSPPRIYAQLTSVLSDESVSVDRVAEILKQDMAMSAKILQIVNSAFFRLSRTISHVEDAVIYLGFDTIKNLALSVEVFGRGGASSIPAGLSIEGLQEHSMLTATIASQLFDEKRDREDAFVAALLHDVGKLLLATELPERFSEIVETTRREGGAMHEAERDAWGLTHAEIGAFLLGLWGIPYAIVEAVAYHHRPELVAQRGFDVLAAVHVANILAKQDRPPVVPGCAPADEDVDPAYLDALGVRHKMDAWRDMARERAEALRAGGDP